MEHSGVGEDAAVREALERARDWFASRRGDVIGHGTEMVERLSLEGGGESMALLLRVDVPEVDGRCVWVPCVVDGASVVSPSWNEAGFNKALAGQRAQRASRHAFDGWLKGPPPARALARNVPAVWEREAMRVDAVAGPLRAALDGDAEASDRAGWLDVREDGAEPGRRLAGRVLVVAEPSGEWSRLYVVCLVDQDRDGRVVRFGPVDHYLGPAAHEALRWAERENERLDRPGVGVEALISEWVSQLETAFSAAYGSHGQRKGDGGSAMGGDEVMTTLRDRPGEWRLGPS